jgi:hypothetical protein
MNVRILGNRWQFQKYRNAITLWVNSKMRISLFLLTFDSHHLHWCNPKCGWLGCQPRASMHALILSKLHPNLCKNSRSLDHLKTLRKPPYNQPQLFFGKIFEFLPPTYTWKFQTISHLCLILHLGENIFPEQGHAFFVYFFREGQTSEESSTLKATLLVNLLMWRVFFGAGFHGCRATWVLQIEGRPHVFNMYLVKIEKDALNCYGWSPLVSSSLL